MRYVCWYYDSCDTIELAGAHVKGTQQIVNLQIETIQWT